MIALIATVCFAFGLFLGLELGKRKETEGESVKGLLTANYVALKRINKILEVVQDEEWKKYTVPFNDFKSNP